MSDFEDVYVEYYPQIYRYLLKLCRNEELAEEVTQETFEQILFNKDMTMQILKILHTLKEPYKEVFWMKTFGELTFGEIGRIHGKTEAWAQTTYHRAKMKIREEMK